jgi:hypothetical protein
MPLTQYLLKTVGNNAVKNIDGAVHIRVVVISDFPDVVLLI